MKKWTKAERERASREGKARWAARKQRSIAISSAAGVPPHVLYSVSQGGMGGSASGGSGGSANAFASAVPPQQALATDIVRLIAHDVPADVIVKVVERILRP